MREQSPPPPPSSSSPSSPPSFLGGGLVESPSALFFLSSLFLQSGGMDFSRVGERILSSVRSARSLGVLPQDRPEVPARAAAAAVIARAIAGLPPHQRLNLPSSSEALVSIYGSKPPGQSPIEELEEDFYMEDFDPVKHVLEHIPSEGNDLTYFEEKATLRLAQLDRVAEQLSCHVMEHHEEMVKGMQLVRELEQDLKVANIICMNGRRHLTSSMHEVSGDLIVHSNAKKKQALVDLLPILSELRRALDMQLELDILVEEGNYVKAFQVVSEYLQLLEGFSGFSAIHEMSRGVETWLTRTLQNLDTLLLGVCQTFNNESYLTVVDAYAIIGDSAGLAEKIQSFFMQEVLSETHFVLKDIVLEDLRQDVQRNRFTYSDLCAKVPESKFRKCLLRTLETFFKLMRSYYSIMSFHPEESKEGSFQDSSMVLVPVTGCSDVTFVDGENGGVNATSTVSHISPFNQLRKETSAFVSRTLDRGKRNLWQLTTSRVSVLLSCSAVCSASTHQFLRNYEDLNVFILAGEAFCGTEAVEFRQRLKSVCKNYIANFHRQNIYALKMVLEKESWVKISADAMQVISLAGLVGDGAPLIAPSFGTSSMSMLHSKIESVESGLQKNGFGQWIQIENPFLSRVVCPRGSVDADMLNDSVEASPVSGVGNNIFYSGSYASEVHSYSPSSKILSALEDENEDLLADFIDEESQLPSRIQKSRSASTASKWNDEEINTQIGSSLCLLRLMDKYARLMRKLEIVNMEIFKGICQLFALFFHFIFETFGQRDVHAIGKVPSDSSSYRLKTTLSRITQDCDQWIRQQSLPCSPTSPVSISGSFSQMDVTPTIPSSTIVGHAPNTIFGLKERCAAAEAISHVAQVLHRSRNHLQSMHSQSKFKIIEDFYENLVNSVPDLTENIHRTTARQLLHINGYADRIANAKWEVKELGMEHNGYVDLLLGEFKHYKTRLTHGGISQEVQDLLLLYGLENVADTLVEGLSRVKKCTDEGRALMSLDLQVLINGLQHFVLVSVRPKFQIVETFIKAYYLPETEYVHWGRSHSEYSKSQVIGLVNLVANMKNWKRKTRLDVLERIEAGQ